MVLPGQVSRKQATEASTPTDPLVIGRDSARKGQFTFSMSQSISPTLSVKSSGQGPHNYDKYARQACQKRPTADVEQFLCFVRDCQSLPAREKTDLALKKKPLLPGIGETNPEANHPSSHAIFPTNNDDIDEEMELYLNNNVRKRTPSPLLGNVSPRSTQTLEPISPNRLSRSRSLKDKNNLNGNSKKGLTRTRSDPVRRATALTHHLPPLEHQNVPDRPSAPPPSVTPPCPTDSDEDDGDSAGDCCESPVDFIDPQ
ncbi:uncharacterized protein LOC106163287 [Lingula anatina]|uniref:Uncharacterized protein LOC106163287 n=1 Tax=Lingula anatina TaxID=7574 RepID=A0A1S3IFP4_LINAN|nr:uncharacterized protein LOC106163287 [Lingula anatina]XP_013396286.1 uncharacterized protein LOC106163287 [Lingula anatina]XP_013396288.1 uncharacterized protein LOC106163287 [Lingula anatina]XP_013396289.1 uncharacterized protein LOC106163287 [Lingula anatina]|eukprot:XP_013396285.1 uncharacterized protein LOC106163287 [Lingula anatina]